MTTTQFADILTAIAYDPTAKGDYKYTLARDVQIEIPEAYAPPAEVRHKWFEIVRGANGWVLTIRKGYAWDGATHASDFSPGGTVRRVMDLLAAGDVAGAVAMAAPLIGSTAHDPLYQFLTYLAKVWGTPEADVRLWADLLFRALMEAAGAAWKVQ